MLSNLIKTDTKEILIEEQRIINILVALLKKYIKETKNYNRIAAINQNEDEWDIHFSSILDKNKSLSVALAFSIAKYAKKLNKLNEKIAKKLRLLKLEIYIIKNILLSIEKLNLNREENLEARQNTEEILKDLIVEADFYQELSNRLEHFIDELKGENIQGSILEMLEIIDKQREFMAIKNREVLLKLSEQEIIPQAKIILGISRIIEHRKKGFRNLREFNKKLVLRDKRLFKLSELEKLSAKKETIAEIFFNAFERLLKDIGYENSDRDLENASIEALEKKAEMLTKEIDKELAKIAPL
ncbi:MAG: hypothetical protein ACP5OZ_04055 [Candidatus Woesearchaeota archaeon]